MNELISKYDLVSRYMEIQGWSKDDQDSRNKICMLSNELLGEQFNMVEVLPGRFASKAVDYSYEAYK